MTQFVVHVLWTEKEMPRWETFGPWTTRDDDGHLAELTTFLRDWLAVTGIQPVTTVLSVIQDPQAWLDGYRAAHPRPGSARP